jgi:hypothetical protein
MVAWTTQSRGLAICRQQCGAALACGIRPQFHQAVDNGRPACLVRSLLDGIDVDPLGLADQIVD